LNRRRITADKDIKSTCFSNLQNCSNNETNNTTTNKSALINQVSYNSEQLRVTHEIEFSINLSINESMFLQSYDCINVSNEIIVSDSFIDKSSVSYVNYSIYDNYYINSTTLVKEKAILQILDDIYFSSLEEINSLNKEFLQKRRKYLLKNEKLYLTVIKYYVSLRATVMRDNIQSNLENYSISKEKFDYALKIHINKRKNKEIKLALNKILNINYSR